MVLFGTGLLAAPENRIEQRIGDDLPHIPLVDDGVLLRDALHKNAGARRI